VAAGLWEVAPAAGSMGSRQRGAEPGGGELLVCFSPLHPARPPFATHAAPPKVLLALARDSTLAALDDLQRRVALLSDRPPALDGYMEYLVGWGGGRGWGRGGWSV
jgi:hypothetical protein